MCKNMYYIHPSLDSPPPIEIGVYGATNGWCNLPMYSTEFCQRNFWINEHTMQSFSVYVLFLSGLVPLFLYLSWYVRSVVRLTLDHKSLCCLRLIFVSSICRQRILSIILFSSRNSSSSRNNNNNNNSSNCGTPASTANQGRTLEKR